MKYWSTFINSFGDYASYLYHEIIYPSWNNYFYWLIGISLLFLLLEGFEYLRLLFLARVPKPLLRVVGG